MFSRAKISKISDGIVKSIHLIYAQQNPVNNIKLSLPFIKQGLYKYN